MKPMPFGILRLALVLAAASVPALAQEDEHKAVTYPMTVFDISALVEPLRDFPGPRFELSPGRALQSLLREEARIDPDEPERPRILTAGELGDLIRAGDPAWATEGEGVSLLVLERKIFVRGPEESVRRVRELIQTLEREANRSFAIRATIVEVPRGTGESLIGKPGQVLPAALAAEKLAGVKAKGGKTLADASVCALASQRVHIVDGRERSIVADYDVEVAQSSAVATPVVEVVRDGLVLDVRPIPSPSGDRVRLDFFVSFTALDPAGVRFDPGNPALGPIDLPRAVGFRMEATATIPTGDVLVLGPLLPSDRAAPGGAASAQNPGEGKPEAKDPPPPALDAYLLLQVREVK
jgi:hypothetical protein